MGIYLDRKPWILFVKSVRKDFGGYFAADNGISEVKSSVWLSEEREGFVLACSEVWFFGKTGVFTPWRDKPSDE